MKHILLLLAACCSTLIATAQSQASYNKAAAALTTCYNNADYTSIWRLFSADMQAFLPQDKTAAFFSGIAQDYGKISSCKFDHKDADKVSYKVVFGTATMAMNLALDNDNNIAGLNITTYIPAGLPVLTRNVTSLRLPFAGEWTVVWGGDTKEQNYHVESVAQKNAFDIVITGSNGNTYKTDGRHNEDYYAYGQPLLAPCDAEVVMAVDGVKDNTPGEENPIYVPGNAVMLKTTANEYMLIAHFKNHSLLVKEGDKIKRDQPLGLCGNSGNSSEPHLHFHIENVEDMTMATGTKCYFDKIVVNGKLMTDYSPVKGDKIKNAE